MLWVAPVWFLLCIIFDYFLLFSPILPTSCPVVRAVVIYNTECKFRSLFTWSWARHSFFFFFAKCSFSNYCLRLLSFWCNVELKLSGGKNVSWPGNCKHSKWKFSFISGVLCAFFSGLITNFVMGWTHGILIFLSYLFLLLFY